MKGVSRIDAHAVGSTGAMVIEGSVTDDAATPLAGARVVLGLTRAPAGSAGSAAVALAHAGAQPCVDGTPTPVLEAADRLALVTDAAGRFCVRMALPSDRYVARFETTRTSFVDGSNLDVPFDLGRRSVTLQLATPKAVVLLDDDATSVDVSARAADDGDGARLDGLALSVALESGSVIGEATTDPRGRASMLIPSSKLGPPGHGELRVSFGGNALFGPSSRRVPIDRVSYVDLRAPEAVGGRLPAAWPSDGVDVRVEARLGCATHGFTGSPTGTVQARVGDWVAGAASLDHGAAIIHVSFPAPSSSEVELRLEYVPNAPWLRARGVESVILPLRATGPWARVPLFLGAAAALAWLVVIRAPIRRPRGARATPAMSEAPAPAVVVLGPPRSSRGWVGWVLDAHDGAPVASARLAIERPGFVGTHVIVETTSDAAGAFAIPPGATRPGDELSVQSAYHATLREPAPPEGSLRIALVSRRRFVLDGLVAWARRQGKPFESSGDPTPADVRRAAHSDGSVARWADAVEKGAYGGERLDAAGQSRIDGLAPIDAPPPAQGPTRAR